VGESVCVKKSRRMNAKLVTGFKFERLRHCRNGLQTRLGCTGNYIRYLAVIGKGEKPAVGLK